MNQRIDDEGGLSQTTWLRLGVVCLVVVLAFFGIKGYRDLQLVREHENELRAKIGETEGRIQVLRDRITRIKDDKATLEQYAREELGWVRTGDLVIVLPEATPAQ